LSPILNNVRKIIDREIAYFSRQYPYNLRKFMDLRLLHSESISAFLNTSGKNTGGSEKKLASLMAGIELLGMGLNLHSFNIEDFYCLVNGVSPEIKQTHKNYTIDLLFGDAFYSRAVLHILEYNDFEMFNSILESLKTVHFAKLALHFKLVETVKKNRQETAERLLKENNADGKVDGNRYREAIKELVEKNLELFAGINALLKNSFLIGQGFIYLKGTGLPVQDSGNGQILEKIAQNFIFLKTFTDIVKFLNDLPEEFFYLKDTAFLNCKIENIKKELAVDIAYVRLPWLESNLRALALIYLKAV